MRHVLSAYVNYVIAYHLPCPQSICSKRDIRKYPAFLKNYKIELTEQRYLFKVLRDTCKFFAKRSNANEDCTIEPLNRAAIDTGISCRFPYNVVGIVSGRSGMALNHGLFCHLGLIDSDFEGKIKVILFNFEKKPYIIRKFDRIAQIRFEKLEPYDLVDIENVLRFQARASQTPRVRGNGSFGSTGP